MKIIQKNNRVLRITAKEVLPAEIKSKKIKSVIKKMASALAEKKEGVAIAAPQIGESLKIFIVDRNIWDLKEGAFKGGEKQFPNKPPIVFINPIIKKISKKKQLVSEGCLSVEGFYGTLRRPEKITVEALDENGKKFSRGVSGLLSQIIQHEIDHLNGVLFTDKAERLEKISNS